MDPERPAASRIAGQPTTDAGVSFTAMGFTLKPGFDGERSDGTERVVPGLRPYRRSAGGDGRPR